MTVHYFAIPGEGEERERRDQYPSGRCKQQYCIIEQTRNYEEKSNSWPISNEKKVCTKV